MSEENLIPITIEDMKQHVKRSFDANQPVMLWGPPGVGKSQGVEQLCKELGYRFIDIRLSQMDAVDLRGIPFRDEKTGRTDWALPKIWPTDEDETTVIMFDEINHATQATLSAAFQAIQERRIGDYFFPKNTRFVAAGNRAKDRTYANTMPTALRNRFTHYSIHTTEDALCAYAAKNNWHPLVTSFMRFMPTCINEFIQNSNTEEERKRVNMVKTNEAFATPRTWEVTSKYLKTVTDENGKVDFDTVSIDLMGTIGKETYAKFAGFAKFYKDMPDLNQLIKKPKEAEVPDAPEILWAISTGLANKADQKNFENIVTYFLRMPNEFQAAAMKDTLSRDPSLAAEPAFAEWTAANDSILF